MHCNNTLIIFRHFIVVRGMICFKRIILREQHFLTKCRVWNSYKLFCFYDPAVKTTFELFLLPYCQDSFLGTYVVIFMFDTKGALW